MQPFPTPDDGLGLIGDLRTFTLDGIEWRVFEYQSPINPGLPRLLILLGENARYERQTFPDRWRTMPPEELLAAMCSADASAFPG